MKLPSISTEREVNALLEEPSRATFYIPFLDVTFYWFSHSSPVFQVGLAPKVWIILPPDRFPLWRFYLGTSLSLILSHSFAFHFISFFWAKGGEALPDCGCAKGDGDPQVEWHHRVRCGLALFRNACDDGGFIVYWGRKGGQQLRGGAGRERSTFRRSLTSGRRCFRRSLFPQKSVFIIYGSSVCAKGFATHRYAPFYELLFGRVFFERQDIEITLLYVLE